MILSAQTIERVRPVEPFFPRTNHNGMTFGLGPAGYDVRIAELRVMSPGRFALASTIERFMMPANVLAYVKDKSSWARRGICLQNTVIEPGWRGFLTLEITNHGDETIEILPGSPIAQIVFHWLDQLTDRPYAGRYQDQPAGPVPAIVAVESSLREGQS